MKHECPHCFGVGYDASGQRCTCNDMPIQFVPVQTWRVALQSVAKLALYLITIAVIIGPTLLMILYSKPEQCKAGEPKRPIIYQRQV